MARDHGMIEPFEPGQVKSRDGERLVSFGTSSYGYDIRCSNEFKIFTNINSAIVDPKNFDANSFVDFRGDICIIPPNSFALARTVEYFRIPRNVLTICLGKCVTGDTRVLDADSGVYRPIAEWGSARRTAALGPGGMHKARVSAFAAHGVKPVWRLVTQSGLTLTATANHPLLTPRGWAPLADLAIGDELAAAVSAPFFGIEPLAAPERLARLVGAQLQAGTMTAIPEAVFRAPRSDVARFFAAVVDRHRAEGVCAAATALDDLRHLAARLGYRCRTVTEGRDVRLLVGAEVRTALANGTDGAPPRETIEWDRISAIEPAGEAPVYDIEVPGVHNFLANGLIVHNSTYARCGIIVNVTPFEPEWEGHVTLEFSNTSPLPAKIYANEGVAQVIFFEADEPCETSYKDRGGKYQGQKGVTLPKT